MHFNQERISHEKRSRGKRGVDADDLFEPENVVPPVLQPISHAKTIEYAEFVSVETSHDMPRASLTDCHPLHQLGYNDPPMALDEDDGEPGPSKVSRVPIIGTPCRLFKSTCSIVGAISRCKRYRYRRGWSSDRIRRWENVSAWVLLYVPSDEVHARSCPLSFYGTGTGAGVG
jgi:hypothetical protein